MSDDGHARDSGHGVLQHFEPFPHEPGAIPGQSREVHDRLREVGDDARTYQVSGFRHNRDGGGRLWAASTPAAVQVKRTSGMSWANSVARAESGLGLVLGIAILEADSVPLPVAEVVQALTEDHVANR